ncbi:MAG TPA: hypothetical protein DCX03_04375 [Bacteroidales bacterium]|nr:hypothetical protein [Bacteroidales bacterium]
MKSILVSLLLLLSVTSIAETLQFQLGTEYEAYTLTGVNAPMFGDKEKQPIIFELHISPPYAKYCTLLGYTNGHYMSERALVSLSSITCRSTEGSVYTGKVDGFVTDLDKIAGIKGDVVGNVEKLKATMNQLKNSGNTAAQNMDILKSVSPIISIAAKKDVIIFFTESFQVSY